MIELQYVDKQYFHQTWPKVENYFAEAAKYSNGEYSLEQIKMLFAQGSWLLVLALDDGVIKGATAVEFIILPNDKVALMVALGGNNIIKHSVFKQFKEMMRSFGATKVRVAARDELIELYTRCGLHKKYTVLESEI